MHHRIRSTILAIASLLSPVVVATVGTSREAVDRVIAQQMNESGIVGLGAAVIVDRRIVWTRGYGFADKANGRPFTPDTVMNVASIAKTMIGVSMMRAVHEGKLSLDEDINTYLPFRVVNPHRPDAKITLRDLATHSSGITDRWAVYAATYHYGGDAPEPLDRFLAGYFKPDGKHYSRDNFIDAAPGQMREYSNIGAALAAYIVERVTDEPFDAYTRKHIFEPLKMDHTVWFPSKVDPALRATPYVSHGGHIIPIPVYGSTTWPDGGLHTSVSELSRFFIAMLGDGACESARILDAEGTQAMRRFQFTAARHPDNFPASEGNSGLFWRTKFNGALVGHGGNDPGVQTEMLATPDGRVAVILFSNTSLEDSGQRASGLIFDALWKHAQALAGATKH